MSRPEERILLVDDEPRLLSGLRRRLSDRFQILTAESADDAVKILEKEDNIGAVLTDMRMPGRDGIDLLVEVAERWPDIRRLMLTGNNDQDTAMAAVNQGRVFRFFRKPFEADQLAVALNEALEEYRFVTGAIAERESLELRARSGAKSRRAFLSTMSHELLTPLNHILGFSSMLELKLKDKEEGEALEYLNYIKDSGESLLRLVQRVLEIVRYTSGDHKRDPILIDIRQTIDDELEHIRSKPNPKNIVVSCQDCPEPANVMTSSHELRMALREIMDNAVKFNEIDGHVSIAISVNEKDISVRVADDGIGMSKETANRALGIFSQGDESIGRRYSGIGLGLTFVAFFARANRGKVSIESEVDAGTAIILSLPRAVEPELSQIA